MGWMSVLEKELWTGFFALILFILGIVLIRFTRRILKIRGDREHLIKVFNQGNIRSFYYLSLASAEPALDFKLFYNHIPLAEAPEPEPVEPEPVVVESALIEPPPEKPKKGRVKDKAASKDKKSQAMDGAAKTGRAVGQEAGKVASFLGAVGSLLPGKMGQGFTEQSAAAREVQADAVKTGQAPGMAQRKVDSVKSASGNLAGGSKKAQASPLSGSPRTGGESPVLPPVNEGIEGGGQQVPPQTTKRKPQHIEHHPRYRVQTQEIGPGESVSLRLQIGSKKKRYPQGSFAYQIASQQVPLDEDKTGPVIPPLINQGIVYFETIRAWRYWLPFFASFTIGIITFLTFVYLLSVIW